MSKIQALQADALSETPSSPGDFFHAIHHEINPSPSEGNDVIPFLHGTGPLVANVDNPEQA